MFMLHRYNIYEQKNSQYMDNYMVTAYHAWTQMLMTYILYMLGWKYQCDNIVLLFVKS